MLDDPDIFIDELGTFYEDDEAEVGDLELTPA